MIGQQSEALDRFRDLVIMPPAELERWLRTDESRAVDQQDDGGESVGEASGRRIVQLLRTHQDDHSDSDFEHMRKVIGKVHGNGVALLADVPGP